MHLTFEHTNPLRADREARTSSRQTAHLELRLELQSTPHSAINSFEVSSFLMHILLKCFSAHKNINILPQFLHPESRVTRVWIVVRVRLSRALCEL